MSNWEPKQGEMVCYRIGDGLHRYTGIFVCMYLGKHLLDDNGDFISVSSVEKLIIETPKQEITVGSVLESEIFNRLYVVIATDGTRHELFCPDTLDRCSCRGFENLKPRPDKIGMAPALVKWRTNFKWGICDGVFASFADADEGIDKQAREDLIWPANNSMWVIVDR